MKVRPFFALGLLALLCLPVGLALADNGPHGGYTATTDACAGCHRAHTASVANLLLSTVPNLCYTCHGSGASGADTNVVDGLDTSVNRSLRAGGFGWVTMDPAWSGGAVPTSSAVYTVTSEHMVDGGSNTVWGYGPITSTVYAGVGNVALTCTNCHNPHGGAGTGGTATYRILKGNGAGNTLLFGNSTLTVTQASWVDIPDESTKTYYTSVQGGYFGDHGTTIGGVNTNAALSPWCAQCHTRYQAPYPGTPGSTDSGDGIYMFRHVTNDNTRQDCISCHGPTFVEYYPACTTCHMAHGTGASMGTYSGAVAWPDGSNSPSGSGRSSLLRMDNRGVCWQCHVDRGVSFP